jgi:hypothetical protein
LKADYTYLDDGKKITAVNANDSGYEYLGSFVYSRNNNVISLESASFNGGRIEKASNGFEINYFITDQLGSTRAVVNQNSVVKDNSYYYPFGLKYAKAADNAKTIPGELGATELTYVGHSLGGGEAALNALVTDRKAITFNATGVSDITKLVEGTWKTPFKSESKIDDYIIATDPLNNIQNNSALPNVNGNRHYLIPTDA